jgi:hypothetical protein
MLITREDDWLPMGAFTLGLVHRYEAATDTAESWARLAGWIRARTTLPSGMSLSPNPIYADGKLRPPALTSSTGVLPQPPLPDSGAVCLVLQASGDRSDRRSGLSTDLDTTFKCIVESTQQLGFACLRHDPDDTAGSHEAMRLLQSAELVIANLTLATPDVLIALGARRACAPRERSCLPNRAPASRRTWAAVD